MLNAKMHYMRSKNSIVDDDWTKLNVQQRKDFGTKHEGIQSEALQASLHVFLEQVCEHIEETKTEDSGGFFPPQGYLQNGYTQEDVDNIVEHGDQLFGPVLKRTIYKLNVKRETHANTERKADRKVTTPQAPAQATTNPKAGDNQEKEAQKTHATLVGLAAKMVSMVSPVHIKLEKALQEGAKRSGKIPEYMLPEGKGKLNELKQVSKDGTDHHVGCVICLFLSPLLPLLHTPTRSSARLSAARLDSTLLDSTLPYPLYSSTLLHSA